MKYVFVFLLSFLMACSASEQNEGELPRDLVALKSMQKEKKSQLRSLEKEIINIEELITELDSNRVVQRKLVTTDIVELSDFEHHTTVQAAIQSDELVSISSETGGKLTAMYLKEGQAVRKGALVAKVDLESLNKQMAELQTQLDLAKDVYERQARLWDQKIGSEVQYLQAKNAVERIEKSLETLQFQVSKANVYAPISGVVDMVNLKAGETAGPGTPIAMILNTYKLKVVSDVPENYLKNIKMGDKVNIYFPALDEELEARVSLIGRKIDAANRTFKVEVDLMNKSGKYKPNLLAEMRFKDFEAKDVLVIAQELVQEEVDGRDFVLLKSNSKDGDVSLKKYVETGQSYDGKVIIESGLNAGDELIIEGALGLGGKSLITVINDK